MSQSSLSLSVSLAQQPATNPTIRVTVKNISQDETYTILKWSSPLDPLALALGLVPVTVPSARLGEEGPGTPFDIPQIMIRRAMPPPADAFVTLSPGESESHDIVLRDPAIDMDQLISAAKQASTDGTPVVNVQLICGIGQKDDGEDQGGAVIWPGRTMEELSEEDVMSLGRGGEDGDGAVRWRVVSNILKLQLSS
ncbi:hypothetical protein V8F20_004216 [Naviculisporaceae sp. PSN 640]